MILKKIKKMKNNKKVIGGIAACLTLASIVSSCKKDNTNNSAATVTPVTTVKQDQDNVLATTNVLADDIVTLMNTPSSDAGTSLITFLNKDALLAKKGNINAELGSRLRIVLENTKKAIHIKNKRSKKRFAKTTIGPASPFNFATKKGTYTWNEATQIWDVLTNSPSDKIIINYPADTNKATINNAKITIFNYTEQLIMDSVGGDTYMPTKLLANLMVDGIETGKVDYTGTYNSKGYPISINLTLFNKPYTVSILFNDMKTSITGDFKLLKDAQAIIGLNGTIAFVTATQEDIKTIDATIQVKQLAIKGNFNIAAANAINMPTAADLNNNFKINIWYNGAKTGDVVFVKDSLDATIPLVKFKDGKTQPAEDFFANTIQKFKDILKSSLPAKK